MALCTVAPLLVLAGVWIGERGSSHAFATHSAHVWGDDLKVRWVDGDSGEIDGRRFRLYGVDAPEGSVSRAQCTKERSKAKSSANAARNLTSNQRVRVSHSYGQDYYGRELVSLSAGGIDVAKSLIAGGHLKSWNYDAGEPKPQWC
jgi:endonuclease YncB( thermonuclease family)